MKKILVPLDFSECSINAVRTAGDIARKNGADIYLLHVPDMPEEVVEANFEAHQQTSESIMTINAAKKRMEQIMQEYLVGLKVARVMEFHDLYDVIVDQAAKYNIDLIVMGTHGVKGWKEKLIGSTTEKIVRFSTVPVLAVKHYTPNDDFKNIVFASNFYGEVKTAFPKIKAFADEMGATIHLAKVINDENFEDESKTEKIMEDFAHDFELKNYTTTVINDDDFEEGIVYYADKVKADVIAIATHGKTGISRLISGSLAEELTNHVNLPVLTSRIEEADFKYGVIFP